MDFAIIEKVVQAFLPHGLKEITPSTIGEPFMYSHFEDFLKLAKMHNLKVNITTNGTFPNGGIAKWLPLLRPVLSDIKFSAMRGKIPKNISEFLVESGELRTPFPLCISLENSRRLVVESEKFTVTVQATLDEGDELDEVPKGVDRIKINQPWILNNPLATSHLPLTTTPCAFLKKEAWVWVDGTFQVCPNPDARFGMRTRIPFGDFGNFATQDPLEIWNGSAYRKFCETYKENPICRSCRRMVKDRKA
jgi:hypothetical protein